jgi:formamidopyrimidine-DNA glycosylase
LDFAAKADLERNRWLKNLGVEPLSPQFNADFLFGLSRGVKASLKAFLMDQRRVVGVGNIYASEALFAAGVRPTRRAGRVSRDECARIVTSVQSVLEAAIRAGGSTISDYKNAHGQDGRFQLQFAVYDRKAKPCVKCGAPIRAKTLVGRATYWCPVCQR